MRDRHDRPTGASGHPSEQLQPAPGIDLYWLPLGAGGQFVRLNGRVYEAAQAYRERRPRLDLYHSALEVYVPEGRFVIETAWPIPDADAASRGVALEVPSSPAGSRASARSDTRCAAGGTARSPTSAGPWPAPSASATTSRQRAWYSSSRDPCPSWCGAATSWGRATCGTRTPWSRGSSRAVVSRPQRSALPSTDALPDGAQGSSLRSAGRRRAVGPSRRGGGIRTRDLVLPKHARCQAALRPVAPQGRA